MARYSEAQYTQMLDQAIKSVMEPGLSEEVILHRLERAARMAGMGNLYRKRREDSQQRQRAASASAANDLVALRKLAAENLAKRQR